jgi:hypothetical protein
LLVVVNEQRRDVRVYRVPLSGNKIYSSALNDHLVLLEMPPNVPAIPPNRLLPSKEASLFREVLNLYESKQLKKGQKTADQILKKFPEHGGMIGILIGALDSHCYSIRNGVHERANPDAHG